VSGYQPVCQTLTCLDPVCEGPTCASKHHYTTVTGREVGSNIVKEHLTFTFGSSYKYDEGKLLQVVRGTGSNIEVENYTYNLESTGQPFATPIGKSTQPRAAGWSSEYLRPQA